MDILRREGVFRLYDRVATLILTDEKQLARIADDPDAPIFDDEERGFSGEKRGLYEPGTTLDSFMRDAAARGCVRVEVSYDFFFGGTTRENYPDSPLTVRAYKQICQYARKHSMSFGASLISPLDLGGGYARSHAETGESWQFREGEIQSGRFSVRMRRQIQWYNNKGPIRLTLIGACALGFRERRIGDTEFYYVDENDIAEIESAPRITPVEGSYHLTGAGYAYDEVIVEGETRLDADRVLVVLKYKTPEQDYFANDAGDYIRSVIDTHAQNGISYAGYYSDEMHIQFDWDLSEHFGPTEITARYVSPGLIAEYARRYGAKYANFIKYMVYFAYAQHDFLGDSWRTPAKHVMAPDADGVNDTMLFRKRYFEMLSERVLELSLDAKRYSEAKFGAPIMTRAHATWQESPTCDHFSEDDSFQNAPSEAVTRYDYAPAYVWSSSIRENMSACYDYFRWNQFLSGAGTDHPEGGNADRNYYAQALAASFGNLNEFEKAYCACWGSPKEIIRRFECVGTTYASSDQGHALCQNMRARISDVLMLYPLELNYAEERYGSWMIQYGYCDYITEEMLIKHARGVHGGRLSVGGQMRSYATVVVMYEPFLSREAFDLFEEFVREGGRLIWLSVPALRYEDGGDATALFLKLFSLASATPALGAISLKGARVKFKGALSHLPDMQIQTELLPDNVYPVTTDKAQVIAEADGRALGARHARGKGECVYLGFRPRDDQSASTGADASWLYDILSVLGAYGEGSLEARSRAEGARYIMNRFPNGAVSVANHYRLFAERWYGSFFRDDKRDEELLRGRELPPIRIELKQENILGHTIDYSGEGALTYLMREGRLKGFAGERAQSITIDGTVYAFSDDEVTLAFSEIERDRLQAGVESALYVRCDRPALIRVPISFEPERAYICKCDYFEPDERAEFEYAEGYARLSVSQAEAGKWIALVKHSK